MDQNTFMETVKNLLEISKTLDHPMTKEEIKAYFKDMELSDEQLDAIYGYVHADPKTDADDVSIADDNVDMNMDEEGVMDEAFDEEDELEKIFRESRAYRMYMEELDGKTKINKDELSMDYVRLLEGKESVIEEIVNAWLPTIVSIAKKYHQDKMHIEDLIQEGNLSLFLLLSDLCGSKKSVDVDATIKEHLEKAMLNYVREMSDLDEQTEIMLGKVNLVYEAQKFLAEENGTVPTLDELAEYTKMDKDELKTILEFSEEK